MSEGIPFGGTPVQYPGGLSFDDLAAYLEGLGRPAPGVSQPDGPPAGTGLNPFPPTRGAGQVDPSGRGTGPIDQRLPPQGSPDGLMFDPRLLGAPQPTAGPPEPLAPRSMPLPPARPSDADLMAPPPVALTEADAQRLERAMASPQDVAALGALAPRAVPTQPPGVPGVPAAPSVTPGSTGSPGASNLTPPAEFDPLTGQLVSGKPALMPAPGVGASGGGQPSSPGAGPLAAQAAGFQPGDILAKFAGGLQNPDVKNLLLNVGIGLMSQRGFGPGVAAGLQGYQSSQGTLLKNQLEQIKLAQMLQGQNAIRGALAGKGLSKDMIEAAALNPTVLSAVLAQQNKDPQTIDVGGNRYLVPPGGRPGADNLLGRISGPEVNFEPDPANPGGQRPIPGSAASIDYKKAVAEATGKDQVVQVELPDGTKRPYILDEDEQGKSYLRAPEGLPRYDATATGAPPGVDPLTYRREAAKAAVAEAKAADQRALQAQGAMPILQRAEQAYERLAQNGGIGPYQSSQFNRAVGGMMSRQNEIDRQDFEAAAKQLELMQAQIQMKGQGAITEGERRILALTLPRLDAAYRDAYARMAEIPGTFAPGALDRMGSRVRDRMGAGMPIDDVLTPNATRAIADLDAVPGIFGLAPGEGPNLLQVNQLRKRLVSYRGGTGQNPTDRAAMDRILSEFDAHLQDAAEAGLFQHRPGPAGAGPEMPAAGFQGMASGPAAPAPFAPAGSPPGRPESLIQYLGRNGGIRLDDDARAADLGRVMTGYGPLGRRNGRSIEDFRDELASEGFIRPDSPDGMISRRIGDEVHDLIAQERAGSPVHRLSDTSRGGLTGRDAARIAEENAAQAERVAPFRQQVLDDLAGTGIRPRDIDPAHLDDAAQRLYRGEHDTGADAYEAAVMGRPGGGPQPAPRGTGPADAVPFEGATAPAGAFPGSDTSAVDAMRQARGLFRDYRQSFAPRSPADAAGRNLQRIVEQDATPNEVAGMLFGGPSGRVTGRQLETLDRLKAVVGEDSPAWQAVRQATIGRYLEGRDVGRSLDYLLRGEGRDLAARVLTPEQRAGLDAFRTGMQQAERARAAVPAWVQDIARTGYDPNRVLADLFGSGIPGARPGSAAYGRGLRQYLGADSPQWSSLRQAAWLKLTGAGEGRAPTPQVEAERIRAFADGEGRGLARTMFSGDELAMMRRYADAVRATEAPRGGRLPDGGRAAAIGNQVLNLLVGVAGAKIGGWTGGLAAYGARAGQQAAQGALAGMRADRAFNRGAPPAPIPLPAYASRAGAAAGRLGGAIGARTAP